MEILQVVLLFIAIINFSESCKPYYECKIIRECPRMIQLQQNRNAGDLEFLRKSNCGYAGKEPMVCCPKLPCWTPDGKEGDCMSIHDCPTIKSSSQAYASTTATKMSKTVSYILNARSRCLNIENGVCCPVPSRLHDRSIRQVELKQYNENQACQASVLPPDPRSNCCGLDPEVGHRISRGAPTNKYTWLAFLEYNDTQLSCAGSLISGLYVLTAAHCVYEAKPVSVLLGVYAINSTGRDCNEVGENCMELQQRNINQTISHPNFLGKAGGSFKNDIALLQLSEMAIFNEFVRPICLPSAAVRFGKDTKLKSAGWGITDYQVFSSNVKMSVEMPFVETKDCAEILNRKLGEGHMCTGNTHGEGPCEGDSGGPLMHQTEGRFEAVGVYSFGTSQCGVNKPHVFTNVTHYLGWIRDSIKILNSS